MWAQIGVRSLLAEVSSHVGLAEAVQVVEAFGEAFGRLQVGLVPIGQGL